MEEEEGKGARGVCWGWGVGLVGWGAVHLRDRGMDGGVEDGGGVRENYQV